MLGYVFTKLQQHLFLTSHCEQYHSILSYEWNEVGLDVYHAATGN